MDLKYDPILGVLRKSDGIDTSDATATASDILLDKTAYVGGEKLTGTIPTVTPSISSNVVTVPKGYVQEKHILTIGTAVDAYTITPGTTAQVIPKKSYLKGDVTIAGDANLTDANIKKDVSIFGVTGTLESGGGSSAEYYKCVSVDTSAKTWTGYKAVFDSGAGTWSFESDVTESLEYRGLTPVVDSIYSTDTTVKIEQLNVDLVGFFELTIAVSSTRMIYKFQPYWNTGGYCKVVDWGDGTSEDAVTSGTVLSHTYSETGTYTLKIKANCYRCLFGIAEDGPINAVMIRDCNFNWQALGNITNGDNMFKSCDQAVFTLTSLPENISTGEYMFYFCHKMVADLDTLASNAPAEGYTSLTTILGMFVKGGNGNSPGTVTGSQAAFLAVCPNLTNTQAAFDNTNTTA